MYSHGAPDSATPPPPSNRALDRAGHRLDQAYDARERATNDGG